MGKRDKKRREWLARKGDHERRALYQRAARLRKAAAEPARRRRKGPSFGEDEEGGFERLGRRRSGSLEEWVERLRAEEAPGSGAPQEPELVEATTDGTVIWLGPGRARVLLDAGGELECLLCPEIAVTQRSDLAVGDRVAVSETEEVARVEAVLARRTALSRLDPGGGRPIERVIAANVDAVVVVVATRTPPLRRRLVDRFLVAVERGGARPILCLAKIDLLESEPALDELLETLGPYRELGIPVLACSSVSGRGLPELRAALAGRTCVLVGQSGVGKSSLLNALDPRLGLETREISQSVGKGRHTTTASELLRLEGDIRVIDTPGIREFGLFDLTREELRWYFHEFDAPAQSCRFGDCSHVHEPDCGVREAVAAGGVAEARYDSYQRLLASIPEASR
ncbi:MAG: ribosome small subunit-dependent GTPase A [Myxococcota bacterium]